MAAIWSRLENEPEDAWKAFLVYRDRSVGRSLYSLGCEPQRALDWYNKYNWHDRVVAYDQLFDSEKTKARAAILARAEAEMSDEIKSQLFRLKELLSGEIARFQDQWSTGTLPTLKPAEFAKLLELQIKYWRLVNGQTTDNNSHEFDFSKFSTEELQALLKKAKGEK